MVVVQILILAAGASSRMRGTDKLLQPVAGIPLLRLIARVAVGAGGPVWIAVPTAAEERKRALTGLDVTLVEVPDAAKGMSRSINRGLTAIMAKAGADDGVMILPADMPGFSSAALASMIAQFQTEPDLILRGGTEEGQSGHPVIFPRDLWPDLLSVEGDTGGQSVLKSNHGRVRVLPLPGRMAVLDLDTPEDWAAWRADR